MGYLVDLPANRPAMNSKKYIATLLLTASIFASVQPHPATYNTTEYDPNIQCTVKGCKTCFTSEHCLLCDPAQHFQPAPVDNTCLC